ncbi:hypothetical protein [Bacillus toyonensis]|uniref:hypothetical protein n=1 Tax=Bacillus toyonensis TaxID=155322 RepID=UPI0006AA42C1|nr:hypothetical protein [Bacillus toyonensis]MED2693557.1 hypothetical protein [Bacillus toyonensis]OKO50764.1 hypothetical protein ABH17_027735 [Bacillus toyonensis]
MKKNKTVNFLNIGVISMLILNLFIFTSRMSFLPWYIEDAWGHLGLIPTSCVLLIIFFKSHKLHKNGEVTILQKFIPIIIAMFSLFILFGYTSDFKTIFALILNGILLIIYLIASWGRHTLSSI